jgi:flagellar biosynthesis GTPase FlhF
MNIGSFVEYPQRLDLGVGIIVSIKDNLYDVFFLEIHHYIECVNLKEIRSSLVDADIKEKLDCLAKSKWERDKQEVMQREKDKNEFRRFQKLCEERKKLENEQARLKAERIEAERREQERIRTENERLAREESERKREKAEAWKQKLLVKIDKILEQDFLSAEGFFSTLPSGIISNEEFESKKVAFVHQWFADQFAGPGNLPDSEQLAAIADVNGHVQVVARAGSGKTATLVNRTFFSCGTAMLIRAI